MSNKVLIAVVVAAIIGIAGGYFVFEQQKNKGDAGDPIASKPKVNETEVTLDASPVASPEAEQKIEEAGATDQNFDAPVTFLPARQGDAVVVGATLSFPDAYNTSRKIWEHTELSGIKLDPPRRFRGHWISDRQFEILVEDVEKPGTKLKVSVESLPLTDETTLSLGTNAGSPWSLVYPQLTLQGAVVTAFSPNISARIDTNWNYKVTTGQLKQAIVAYHVDENGKETPLTDIRIGTSPSTSSKSQTVNIFSNKMKTGRLKFVVNKDIDVAGVKSNPRATEMLVLSPPGRFTINQVSANEGSDAFSLQFRCRLENRSYYRGCKVNAETAADYITVDPPVNFNVVSANGKFTLIGAFAANTAYKVTIRPGLQANDSAILESQYTRTVRTGAFKPTFRFVGKARYLPSITMQSLPYEARNVKDIKVYINQIFPQKHSVFGSLNMANRPTAISPKRLKSLMPPSMRKTTRNSVARSTSVNSSLLVKVCSPSRLRRTTKRKTTSLSWIVLLSS